MRKFIVLIMSIFIVGTVANFASAATYSTTPIGPWHPADGIVSDIQRIDNVIYIGGSFTALVGPNGQRLPIARLAAFDATTGNVIASFNPNPSAWVRVLETNGTVLIVGGDFNTIGGVARSKVAIVTTAGTVTGWKANANGSVRALEVANDTLYIGGAFTTIGGVSRNRLASVSLSTAALNTWKPSANNTVTSLITYTDIGIIVGGRFTNLANTAVQYIGAVTFDGTISPYHPTVLPCSGTTKPCFVLGLATDGVNIYVAIAGPGGRVNAFNHAGTRIWTRTGDGDNQAIAVYDGKVYVGGHFGPSFGGVVRNGLVVLGASNGAIDSFAPSFIGNLRVWSLYVDGTGLYVGGEFTSVNNNKAFARFVKFNML